LIIYQKTILRADLMRNPSVLYIFGDNVKREGLGGQAWEMRGEPNAFGICTKRAPDSRAESYFSDDSVDDLIQIINDLKALRKHIDWGLDAIVFPADGIGTGLSDLPQKAPRLWAYLNTELMKFGIVNAPG